MKVYLVRHGEATAASTDPERCLSKKGTAQISQTAQFLKKKSVSVTHIWHSTRMRARQTAEGIAEVLGADVLCEQHAGLGPDDPVDPLAQALSRHHQDVLVVGHLPFLKNLAFALLEDANVVSKLHFDEASVQCLERTPDGMWRLCWTHSFGAIKHSGSR